MKRIILVRHGQNSMVGKRLAGWLPGVHLNEVGKAQAAALAERLGAQKGKIVALYSSPVTRCQETARPIADAFGLPLQTLEGVGEVLYGEWEGKSIAELAKLDEWKVVQRFPSAMRFPAGERMRDVQMRAIAAVEEVANSLKEGESAIICSHADVIKSIAAHYAGIHFDLFQRLIISAASISIIGLTPYAPRIICLNDCAHIPAGKDPELPSNNHAASSGESSPSPKGEGANSNG